MTMSRAVGRLCCPLRYRCYMDIGIGNKYAGRIIIGLYSRRVPMTCENFVQLCEGYKVGEGETERLVGYR